MRIRTVTALLLGAVLSITSVVGCTSKSPQASTLSDDGGGSKGKDVASSTSPSPSSGSSLHPFPHKGVTDAADAWLAASNKAMKTLDPEPLLALSDPACENCNRFADYLRDLKKNGGHLGGDYAEVVRGTKAPKVDGATGTVILSVERGKWTEYSKAGAKPQTIKSESYDIKFDLRQENGTWTVTEVLPMLDE